MTPSEPDASSADPLEPHRRWASTLFTILAIVGIVGGIVLAATPNPAQIQLLLASILLAALALLAVVNALWREDEWAVHAIAPLCYVIIAAGVIRALAALSQGTIPVPLEVIGAAMVLSREHRATLLPLLDVARRRRARVAVAAVIVANLLPYAGAALADGRVFGAQPAHLGLSVTVDCAGAAESGRPIPVQVAWSWARGEPFPPPTDGLLVLWYAWTDGAVEADASAVVVSQPRSSDETRIWPGGAGPASGALQHMAQGSPSIEYGIDQPDSGLLDGAIDLELLPADPTARSGGAEVWAWYAHGDRWLHRSETASCSW